jgi:hypothetical protein
MIIERLRVLSINMLKLETNHNYVHHGCCKEVLEHYIFRINNAVTTDMET